MLSFFFLSIFLTFLTEVVFYRFEMSMEVDNTVVDVTSYVTDQPEKTALSTSLAQEVNKQKFSSIDETFSKFLTMVTEFSFTNPYNGVFIFG